MRGLGEAVGLRHVPRRVRDRSPELGHQHDERALQQPAGIEELRGRGGTSAETGDRRLRGMPPLPYEERRLTRGLADGALLVQKYTSTYTLMQALVTQVDLTAICRAQGVPLTDDTEVDVAKAFDAHAAVLRAIAERAMIAAEEFARVAAEERDQTANAKDLAARAIALAKGL